MKKLVFLLLLLPVTAAFAVTITWNQWPYGARNIGSYFKWKMSPDRSHITVPEFNPDDTLWDLVNIGGSTVSRNAESYIRPKTEAQGSPPSYCSYAEKQVFSGATSWGYEHMDTTGLTQSMWLYGFYTQSTQIDYRSPYNRVYTFPMSVGTVWGDTWTWSYMGLDEVTEMRYNTVVAQGKVRVPADSFHWYPCLVIRTNSTSQDELGQINEIRIIYEWVVPDMGTVGGSVATIQSQNGEASPYFTDAEHIFRQVQFHSVFDNQPPSFVNTTVIPTGYNLGPFFVGSRISDASSVVKDSIYYRIGAGPWQAAGHDSMRTTRYYFHIPALSGADDVEYYLAASDTAAHPNRGTDPMDAPANAFRFTALDPADDHRPPVITGTTRWNDTAFTGPFPVATMVTDSCSVDSAFLLYRINTGAEVPAYADSMVGSMYYFTIPEGVMNTFIRYRIRAVDGSPNRNAAYDPSTGNYSFNIVDNAGPVITGTTVWPDTDFAGPFPVRAYASDPSGIQRGTIHFQHGTSNWDSLPADSTHDSTLCFHVPSPPAPMSVRYYLRVYDNSQRHNWSTDPADAPGNYYIFYCSSGGIEEQSEAVTGLRLALSSVNPREAALVLPQPARVTVAIYDLKGSRIAELSSGPTRPGNHRFPIPSGLVTGSYIFDVRSETEHVQRTFVVTR